MVCDMKLVLLRFVSTGLEGGAILDEVRYEWVRVRTTIAEERNLLLLWGKSMSRSKPLRFFTHDVGAYLCK